MNHPAEIKVARYLEDAVNGKSSMSKETIKQVCKDIEETLTRQFGSNTKRDKFKIRMSNVGRPHCQLWFEKNKPNEALPKPTTFVINMMIGDIIEATFKGILKEAGVEYENSSKVTLKLDDNTSVDGTYDLSIDNSIDDIKSASNWSYQNKFESFETLAANDSFGYIAQLAGYAKAANKKAGGWWVVNKTNGEFKYVSSKGIDSDKEVSYIKDTIDKLDKNKFARCYEEKEEVFRGKPTGNKILGTTCSFCSYRYKCWSTLQELPSLVSQAKIKRKVAYVEIAEEYKNG